MPSVTTQQQLQRARKRVDHCYLCGKPLVGDRPVNRDHAPPKALFVDADHATPMILPTHVACNGNRSQQDEIVGQLFYLLHGRQIEPQRDRRGLEQVSDTAGGLHVVLPARHVFFEGEIDRWVRACHATLYGRVLPKVGVQRNIHPPMPTGEFDEEGRICFDQVLPQVPKFVEVIRRNRAAGTLDRIEAWNGKFRYECTWLQGQQERWACVWAMRVYDWERLGETWQQEPRGCTGYYESPEGKPPEAAIGITEQLSVFTGEPLNPFAEEDPPSSSDGPGSAAASPG